LGVSVAAVTIAGAMLAPAAVASPGSQLWVKRYNGQASAFDGARAVAVSPDGSRVFVTGTSDGSPDTANDYATIAYDAATGSRLWLARFNGSAADLNDAARAIAVSPDGSTVFVTGESYRAAGVYTDYATVAYNAATGAERWSRRYNGTAGFDDSASAVGVSPDGSTVFVTGSTTTSTHSLDYVTLAYNAATGATRWTEQDRGGLDPSALGVGHDGAAIFVTGDTVFHNIRTYYTAAYDATSGAKLWQRRYGARNASANALATDGSIVWVTGASAGRSTFDDFATVAYDASTGSTLWVQRYNGQANSDDFARALGVSPDGSRVFVTGWSSGSGTGSDYATVAYEASTGVADWTKRYNGPANGVEDATALGVATDGSAVFVTGSSEGSSSEEDYATLAYDASSGATLWTERYNDAVGNSTDTALALGVNDSTVFVTGESYRDATQFDYATVAYDAG
jgi:hypothetical protein